LTSPQARGASVLHAHAGGANAVWFSRDGKLLITAGEDADVRCWQVPGLGAAAVLRGHRAPVHALAASNNGAQLASCATDGMVHVWALPKGQCLRVVAGQRHAVLSPDGGRLATIDRQHRVQLHDVATGALQWSAGLPAKRLVALAFSPDGKDLLACGDGPLQRLDPVLGKATAIPGGHDGVTLCARFTRDGHAFVTSGSDGALKVWSAREWTVQRTILGARGTLQLAVAPDGRSFAATMDGAVVEFALGSGKLLARRPVAGAGVQGVATSPDGRWLAAAATDGRVRVWPRQV
jgi:WD40 repeat protein